MTSLPVRLYASFAAGHGGGNMAGVVYDRIGLTKDQMQAIAADMSVATTGFVRFGEEGEFHVRFFSSDSEMDMCGHVTIGVFTSLLEDGEIDGSGPYTQITPAGPIGVTIHDAGGDQTLWMRQGLPVYDFVTVTPGEIAPLLGIDIGCIAQVGCASTALRHLFVELKEQADLTALAVNDQAIRSWGRAHGIDTIGVWSERQDGGIRVRDLCHPVGDPEEAASGTTSGALASLLFRDGRVTPGPDGHVRLTLEMGYEMGRPSHVAADLTTEDGAITAVDVGGTAARRLTGEYLL